ncbi:hypothetical protein E4U34_003138 [Claviceps purpurea]|nr:hypothetical protein E4U34_003138 [Claviceps purpurea]KAG6263710.1 hypothetical protein E4U48_006557 [Claviceps purpurea]
MSNNNYPHYYLFKADAFYVNADWKNNTNMTIDLGPDGNSIYCSDIECSEARAQDYIPPGWVA